MSQIRLSISGMACAGCVSAVEDSILTVDGVEKAVVNLGERTATVEGKAPASAIIQAIKAAGYDAAELKSLADESQKEQLELKAYRKLWQRAISAGLVGLVLLITGMGGFMPPIKEGTAAWLVVSLVSLLVLVFVGGHFFKGAWASLKAGRGNMDTLVALGTGTAWVYSTFIVLFPESVPEQALHVYFEAAVIIIALVSLGSALETKARGKTSEAIKRLIGLQPSVAHVIRNGQEQDIPVEDIGLEETIRIKPGERIPVDGILIEGESFIDESMLTGEPMPVAKSIKESVYGGTLNTKGSFLMTATKIGSDTVLAHIIEQVRNAQSSKPQIGRLVDKVAAIFVPVVVSIAVLSFIIWSIWGPEPKIAYAMVSAMTVLVIACPCALGLATPISIMVGVGRAAEQGILIRNGEALQSASQLTHIVLDKTGTVTEGKPSVTDIIVFNGSNEETALQLAAALEQGSEHPLAAAIIHRAKQHEIEIPEVADFEAITGFGVQATVDNTLVRVGNQRFMEAHDIDVSPATTAMQQLMIEAKTPIFLAQDDQLRALIGVADSVRSDSATEIARMQSMGLVVIMLTGDQQATAQAVAKQVGVDEVIAEVLPQDKTAKIIALQDKGYHVAMVGDGINDAPALTQANVGLAIGSGTDVAIESSDIVLMRHSLKGVADAISLSKATMKNIKQNLVGAFIYNTLGIPVAAGVLFPFFGILLSPIVAAAAMSMSSVTVVTNALRLKKQAL